jgi:hypothetical protein
VHIPGALNDYKEFLRGQNHYDSFILSGVSGRGARAFYYPPQAQSRCAGCHMPLQTSATSRRAAVDATALQIHDHRFLAPTPVWAPERRRRLGGGAAGLLDRGHARSSACAAARSTAG